MNAGAFRDPLRYRGVLLMPPPTVHMVPYVTGGLKQIYLNIQNREGRRVYEVGSYTDGRGHFVPQVGMPLLALRYNYLETLGKGQSSVIIKAEDTFHSNNLVAIKVLHTTYFPIGSQEVDIMLEVNKDDPLGYVPIIRLLNIFSFDDHYCLVFQLLQPDPITDHFKKLKFIKEKSLKAIREVTVKLLTVLGFLYRENIIHADLKPDNILLGRDEDTSFRVVDFGNAIRCVHDELSLYYSDFELQALIYRAPEVMFGLSFGLEVDMWSLGCILAELYIGEPLFLGRNKEEVLKKMVSVLGPLPREYQRGKFYFQYNQWIGNALPKHETVQRICQALHSCKDWAFVNFIAGLLAYKPEERLTPWAAANHSFVASYLPNLYLTPINYGGPELYPRVSLNHSNYQHQLKCEISNGRHRQRWESYSLLKKKSKERLSNKNFQTVSPSHMEDLKISSGEAESLQVNISPSTEHFSSSSSQENLTSTGTLDQHSLSDSACNFTSKASNHLTELVSEDGSNSASPRTSSSVKSDTVLNGIKYKGFRSAAKPSSSQEASIDEMFSLRSKWFPPKNDDSESDNSSHLETSKGSNSKHLSCSTENQEKKFKSCKDTVFYQKDIKRKSLSKFQELQKGSKFEDTSFKSALKRPQDLPLFLDKNTLQNYEYSYFPPAGKRSDRIPESFLKDDSQNNQQETVGSRNKGDSASGRSLKSSSSKKSYSRPYMKRLPKEPKNNSHGDQSNGTYLNKMYHPLYLKTSLQKKSKQKSTFSVLSSSDIDCLSHPNNSSITHQQTCDTANIRLNVNQTKSGATSETCSNQDDDKMASLLRQSRHEHRKPSKRLPGVSCGIKTNGLLQKDSRFKGKDIASTSKASFIPEAETRQASVLSHNKSTQVELERFNDSSGSSCMTVKDEAQCASELFDYRDHQSESSASWMEDYSSSSNSYSSGSPKQKGWHLLEPFNANNPEDDVVLLLDSND